MKKLITILAALLVCGVVNAAQDTDISLVEVRNPLALRAWLNANAADAESRLTSGSTNSQYLALISYDDAGTAYVTLQADKADDAGDYYRILATDGSGLEIQSDIGSKGTLSTVASIENTGLITSLVGIDAIGAVDFDIGSADVLDVTIVVENGTYVFDDGTLTASDDLVATDDVTVGDDLTVTGAASVGETLAVTGVATFTAESVHNGGIDADYVTLDAGYGVDTKSAGTLMLGESTATKVEIADAGVETEVQGTLDVHGGLDVNEDVTIDLDATDEEIVITQSSTSGTASTPLIFINDDRTGATANETTEATIYIDAEGTYGVAIYDGALYVEGVSELVGAITGTGDLTINGGDATINNSANGGAATLTFTADKADDAADYVKFSVADGGTLSVLGTTGTNEIATLTQAGALAVDSTVTAAGVISTELDAASAAALLIGKATATGVTIGAADITTTVSGPFVASAALWLGTNGYFQVVEGALQFVGHNGFTNAIDADITQ